MAPSSDRADPVVQEAFSERRQAPSVQVGVEGGDFRIKMKMGGSGEPTQLPENGKPPPWRRYCVIARAQGERSARYRKGCTEGD